MQFCNTDAVLNDGLEREEKHNFRMPPWKSSAKREDGK
jgi:hypothetical protein